MVFQNKYWFYCTADLANKKEKKTLFKLVHFRFYARFLFPCFKRKVFVLDSFSDMFSFYPQHPRNR